jgi:hypothetical protein
VIPCVLTGSARRNVRGTTLYDWPWAALLKPKATDNLKRQTQRVVSVPGQSAQHRKLVEQLQTLRDGPSAVGTLLLKAAPDLQVEGAEPEPDENMSFAFEFALSF